MQQGIYTFYNQRAGRYLTCSGRALELGKEPQLWEVRESGKDGFYVYAHKTDLLLDIDNAWVQVGNTVKIWPYTGHVVQIWRISKNSNGSYSLLHSADPRYCLGFCGEKAVLQHRVSGDPMQQWQLTDMGHTVPKPYLSVLGKTKVVELQLPQDIDRVLPMSRLQLWADQLEIAYSAFQSLTGFCPFRSIKVEAYVPSPYEGYAGWVFPDSNVIHVAPDFLRKDLERMGRRAVDWNFCVLHEMGHIFDFGMPWNFEAELMTDLKVAYVMEACNAAAAPAEFPATTCFYGKDIKQAYAQLGKDLSVDYDVFSCAKRFLDIKDKIGWEPFRQTFRYLYQNRNAYTDISKGERFELFLKTLHRFSGQDIKKEFTQAELSAIGRKTQSGQ